jgi:hypothetical protein
MSVTFEWGRTDCTSVNAPNTTDDHVFPTATMTSVDMFDYFAAEFELTPLQVRKTFSFLTAASKFVCFLKRLFTFFKNSEKKVLFSLYFDQ